MPRADDYVEKAAACVELQFGNALTDLTDQLFNGIGRDGERIVKLEVAFKKDAWQTPRSPACTKIPKPTEFTSKKFGL